MKATQIQLETHSDGTDELSAEVSVLKPHPRTYRIWFRGPKGCFGDAPLATSTLPRSGFPQCFFMRS